MEFQLLGPLEAGAGGQAVDIGRRQERLLLGILLLGDGRHVTTERLLDLIWNGNPSASARSAVHTYVARLRTSLRPYGVSIVGQAGGYGLSGDIDTDVSRFADLARHALAHPDPAIRAERLKDALDLWRGPLLADVADDRVRERVGHQLNELRLACVTGRAEALLALGRPEEVVGELGGWLDAEFRHEALIGLLMLALYRARRRGQALRLYDDLRRKLDEELGVGPSPELADLHVRILRDDRSLDLPRHGPNHLPATVSGFVGRAHDMAVIDALVDGEAGAPIAITALGGMAGVGKTTIAVEWARRAAHRFPDGRFYINLRGYDIDEPVGPKEALAYFLVALGRPSGTVPDDLASMSALYRGFLAGKRALILLDNARNADQVRPLVPNSPGSVVLVTSRDRMTGLVIRDGARSHVIDVLPADESEALLRVLIGSRRVDQEPQEARALADRVGRLPLALRVAGAYLASEPRMPIRDLLDRLSAGSALDELDVPDDPRTSLRSLFRLSYEGLDDAARRLLRLIGAAPVIDITAPAAAVLADLTGDLAVAALDRLAELSFVTVTDGRRYSSHDLVRDFARECAEPDETRHATVSLLDWYVRNARAATLAAYPALIRLPYPDDGTVFGGPLDASAFLDAETDNLILAVRAAATSDLPAAWLLADTLRNYFFDLPNRPQWMEACLLSLGAATRAGDARAQMAVRGTLGMIESRLGHNIAALEHLEILVALSEEAGWPDFLPGALGTMGSNLYSLGRLEEAERAQLRALAMNREAGSPLRAARNLVNLALVQGRLGRLADAVAALREACDIFLDTPETLSLAVAKHDLGVMLHQLGRLDEAEAELHSAIALYRVLRNGDGEGLAVDSLAAVERDRGELPSAEAMAVSAIELLLEEQEAESVLMARNTYASVLLKMGKLHELCSIYEAILAESRGSNTPRIETQALIGLARVDVAGNRLAHAAPIARSAVAFARERGFRLLEADALTVLAEATVDIDPDGAYHAAQAAANIYHDAGVPETLGRAAHLLATWATRGSTAS